MIIIEQPYIHTYILYSILLIDNYNNNIKIIILK